MPLPDKTGLTAFPHLEGNQSLLLSSRSNEILVTAAAGSAALYLSHCTYLTTCSSALLSTQAGLLQKTKTSYCFPQRLLIQGHFHSLNEEVALPEGFQGWYVTA